MANQTQSPGPVERGLVVAIIVLPLVFIILFVLLSGWYDWLGNGGVYPVGPFGTHAAFMTYAVIVAGALGTVARHVADHLRGRYAQEAAKPPPLLLTLFGGGVAAFVVALLLPSALLNSLTAKFDLGATLLVALAAGYFYLNWFEPLVASLTSRSAIKRLEASFADSADKVLAALAPPELSAFEAKLSIDIRRGDRSVVSVAERAPRANIVGNTDYVIELGLSRDGEGSTDGALFPIKLEGKTVDSVALQISVDTGFADVPLLEASIEMKSGEQAAYRTLSFKSPALSEQENGGRMAASDAADFIVSISEYGMRRYDATIAVDTRDALMS